MAGRKKVKVKGKKVVQSRKVIIDGIQFASVLESVMYKLLKEAGIKFTYEGKSFQTFEPLVLEEGCWERATKRSKEMIDRRNVTKVSYTPDFIGEDEEWFIEVKGRANESFPIKVFFAPSHKRPYKINVPVEAIEDILPHNLELGYHNPGSAITEGQSSFEQQTTKKFNIEVFGEGSDGSIQVSEEEINFKTVKIGEQRKLNVVLKNSSSCAFFIDLQFKNNKFE